jgi:predicted CXXCH cytochrome family protein
MGALSVLFFFFGYLFAQQGGTHPVPLPSDFDVAKCTDCHTDKTEGKYVHSAMVMGCNACHEIETKNDETTIKLLAPPTEICTTCHELEKKKVMHGPYEKGQCLACHNPHSSDYAFHTRAEVDTLCLSCHGVNQPGVKAEDGVVTVLGGQTIPLDEYRQAPKIGLDRSGMSGHPIMGHPIGGRDDPRKKGTPLSCVSCHAQHSSDVSALMPAQVKSDIDLCTRCHK